MGPKANIRTSQLKGGKNRTKCPCVVDKSSQTTKICHHGQKLPPRGKYLTDPRRRLKRQRVQWCNQTPLASHNQKKCSRLKGKRSHQGNTDSPHNCRLSGMPQSHSLHMNLNGAGLAVGLALGLAVAANCQHNTKPETPRYPPGSTT